MTILVALDGVIRSEANTPIREGRILYDALVKDGRVVLLCNDEKELAEHWLTQYGVRGYAGILTPSVTLTDNDPIRPRQIAVARSMGRVDMVVDADPAVISHCIDIEVPSLLFMHPKTTRPAWRPEERRTWGDIEAALERQKEKEARVVPDDPDHI